MTLLRKSQGLQPGLGPARSTRIGVNLAAMIDVVFLLLLYFMVATDFRSGEDVFRLDLPDRGAGLHEALYEQSEEPLIILVMEDPAHPGECVVSLEGDWPTVENPKDLAAFLTRHRVGGTGEASEAYFARNHPIIILAGSTTAWAHVVSAFNAVVEAGYDAVSLEVQT
ncbi:MAG: biopolymer transporter ExbD [Planctomycetota bacterium]|nr:biopolymer transporter ExbD [Planctomycetota bacterium]